jgi:Holliday junction resolvase RusA-like endonuclease
MALLQNEYRFWVRGAPLSLQSDKKHSAAYEERIQAAAKGKIPGPFPNARIEITIVFGDRRTRPDVDNIAKRIVDALEGIVYVNDNQVVKVCVATVDASVRELAGEDHHSIAQAQAGEQFLVNILVNHPASIVRELRTT